MTAYIVRRVLLAAFSCLVISVIAFFLIQLPEGDYADFFVNNYRYFGGCGEGVVCTEEAVEQYREDTGLNEPLVKQYWVWISAILFRADFGDSLIRAGTKVPVTTIMAERLPATIGLMGFVILLTWSMAIPIGIYSAVRQHSIGDYAFTFLGFTGLAVPDFLLGLVLLYVFFAFFDQSVGGLFSGEYVDVPWSFGRVVDLAKHLIIPAIVLGTSGTAGLIRIMRNNLLDELEKPYVVTARAKGMANWRVIAKYPVRVAINPFVSTIGSMFPNLVGGSIIVSVVLSLPTLGVVLLEALRAQDPQLAGTMILLLGVLTIVGVLISDLLLVVVDPRIKLTDSQR